MIEHYLFVCLGRGLANTIFCIVYLVKTVKLKIEQAWFGHPMRLLESTSRGILTMPASYYLEKFNILSWPSESWSCNCLFVCLC